MFYWSRPSKNVIPPEADPKIGFKIKNFEPVYSRNLDTWENETEFKPNPYLSHCIIFPFFLEKGIWRSLLAIMSYV